MITETKSIRIEQPDFVSRVQKYADRVGAKTLSRVTQSLAESELSRREAGVDIAKVIDERDVAVAELANLRSRMADAVGGGA